MNKTCGKCLAVKKITDFYQNLAKGDGRGSWCKECDDANRSKNRAAMKRKRGKRTPMTKTCRKCAENKPSDAFSVKKDSADGLYSYCKSCKAAMVRDHRARNGARVRETDRKRNATPKGRLATRKAHLKSSFDMSKAQFDTKWREQGSACAICNIKRKRNQKAFAVDHDHRTDAIRGILCIDCNRALGLAGDDIELLKAAAAYLRKTHRRATSSQSSR